MERFTTIQGYNSVKAALDNLECAINSSADGVIVVDGNGEVVFANPAAQNLFDSSNEKLIGAPFGFPVSSKTTTEVEVVRQNGKIITAEMKVVDIDWKGKPGHLATFRDMTEHEEFEKKLRQVEKAEAIGQIASGLAHELNNLLLPIVSLSGMVLSDTPADSRNRKRLEKILEAGIKAKMLIKDFMAFSKQDKIDASIVDIRSVAEMALEMVKKGLPSSIITEEDLSPDVGTVFVDRSGLAVAIANLCTNARDAMEGQIGTLKVELRRIDDLPERIRFKESHLQQTPYARLSVTDTGRGMDENEVRRAFDPFFTTKEVGSGLGLGLSTVFGLVTRFDGLIDVSSQPGKGTVVSIYLPLCDDPSASVTQ